MATSTARSTSTWSRAPAPTIVSSFSRVAASGQRSFTRWSTVPTPIHLKSSPAITVCPWPRCLRPSTTLQTTCR